MPRPRNAVKTRDLHVCIPEEDAARLELFLWSEAAQRIPDGSKAAFVSRRIREFFARKSIDLALYFYDLPTGSYVYGPEPLVERLKLALNDMELVKNV